MMQMWAGGATSRRAVTLCAALLAGCGGDRPFKDTAYADLQQVTVTGGRLGPWHAVTSSQQLYSAYEDVIVHHDATTLSETRMAAPEGTADAIGGPLEAAGELLISSRDADGATVFAADAATHTLTVVAQSTIPSWRTRVVGELVTIVGDDLIYVIDRATFLSRDTTVEDALYVITIDVTVGTWGDAFVLDGYLFLGSDAGVATFELDTWGNALPRTVLGGRPALRMLYQDGWLVAQNDPDGALGEAALYDISTVSAPRSLGTIYGGLDFVFHQDHVFSIGSGALFVQQLADPPVGVRYLELNPANGKSLALVGGNLFMSPGNALESGQASMFTPLTP